MLHDEMPATELQKWEYLPASLVSLVLQDEETLRAARFAKPPLGAGLWKERLPCGTSVVLTTSATASRRPRLPSLVARSIPSGRSSLRRFGRRFDCSQALVRAIRHYRLEIVSAAPWKVGRAKPLPIKPIRYLRAALAGGSDRLRHLELPSVREAGALLTPALLRRSSPAEPEHEATDTAAPAESRCARPRRRRRSTRRRASPASGLRLRRRRPRRPRLRTR